MKYQGYTITAVKEKTLEPQGDAEKPPVNVTSYSVSIGDKVVAAGLPTSEMAKKAINSRRKARSRAGRDPEG